MGPAGSTTPHYLRCACDSNHFFFFLYQGLLSMPKTNQTISIPEIRRVNRAGLARVFGAAVADIDKWLSLGCPYIKRAAGKGNEWVFDTADVANWILDRARRGLRPILRSR